MNYFIQYEPDYPRILPSMIIECRAAIPAIKNQTGTVIKRYVDNQKSFIKDNSIFYKVEADNGVLAGVFSVDVNANKTVLLNINFIRPSFLQYKTDILKIINNFINSNKWQQDYLF
jgi:hypothetical protein